jgi:hypothetical protein
MLSRVLKPSPDAHLEASLNHLKQLVHSLDAIDGDINLLAP